MKTGEELDARTPRSFGKPENSHVQLYLRPDAITKVEFERSDRKVDPPGFHRDPGSHPEDLLITTLMSDDDLRRIVERLQEDSG